MPKSHLILIAILFLISSYLHAQPFGACGPVEYYHPKVMDKNGYLDSWHKDLNGPFDYILKLCAEWWKKAPDVNGWPSWCTAAELDRNYHQFNGAVPGSTCSFAIISCLKYYIYSGDSSYLEMAKRTGDYIIGQDLTPLGFKYYGFPFAVGKTGDIHPDGSGHPAYDKKYNPAGHIQPDKGAMLGYSFVRLYKVTGNRKYLQTAINIADCLSDNAVSGTSMNSPWPMRVSAEENKTIDGLFSANVSYACRLFDELIKLGEGGHGKYLYTRNQAWNWLKKYVIPFDDGSKWEDFFEDHSGDEFNPLQTNALETVRYLLEERESADPDWFNLSSKIIKQVLNRWALSSMEVQGYVCLAEQEKDKSPYNSHTARLGSILAMFIQAGGDPKYMNTAYSSLCYGIYSVEDDGFAATYYSKDKRAWTSDSFGDFIGHYIDAFGAFPQWAGNGNHLLRSESTVIRIKSDHQMISYSTFEKSGADKIKLIRKPLSVTIDGKAAPEFNWDEGSKILSLKRSDGSNVVITL